MTVSIDPTETPPWPRQEERLPQALRPPRRRAGLALPDRRRARSAALDRVPSGSSTPTTRKSDQYAHPAGLVVRRPRGKSPATSTGSSSRSAPSGGR